MSSGARAGWPRSSHAGTSLTNPPRTPRGELHHDHDTIRRGGIMGSPGRAGSGLTRLGRPPAGPQPRSLAERRADPRTGTDTDPRADAGTGRHDTVPFP